MKAGRAAGRHVDRLRKLDPDKLEVAVRLIAEGKPHSVSAHLTGVDVSTLRRAQDQKG